MSQQQYQSSPSLPKEQVSVKAHTRSWPKPQPIPRSVQIASCWQNPAQEITPAFLNQLAEDWGTSSQ